MKLPNHVFIIDDDPSVRKGLTRLLRAAGYWVKDFASEIEFLNIIELLDIFDDISGCILLDVRMLGLSSKKMVASMRHFGRRLPIIIVTSDDSQEARKLAKEIGAIGFFSKPVDGTALIDAIKWTIKIKKSDGNYMGMNTDSIK